MAVSVRLWPAYHSPPVLREGAGVHRRGRRVAVVLPGTDGQQHRRGRQDQHPAAGGDPHRATARARVRVGRGAGRQLGGADGRGPSGSRTGGSRTDSGVPSGSRPGGSRPGSGPGSRRRLRRSPLRPGVGGHFMEHQQTCRVHRAHPRERLDGRTRRQTPAREIPLPRGRAVSRSGGHLGQAEIAGVLQSPQLRDQLPDPWIEFIWQCLPTRHGPPHCAYKVLTERYRRRCPVPTHRFQVRRGGRPGELSSGSVSLPVTGRTSRGAVSCPVTVPAGRGRSRGYGRRPVPLAATAPAADVVPPI